MKILITLFALLSLPALAGRWQALTGHETLLDEAGR